MGITATGAWEAVKRHFREMGVDTQTEDFTVVGVGDMSGDVFGNGMLLSQAHPAARRVRPPAHLPRPEPRRRDVVGRRKRLFDLPRQLDDYDGADQRGRRRVQPGAEVHPDQRRRPGPRWASTPTSGADPARPDEAILKAPADLLFNGGIGTYVKAETESDADVGDRANDAVRVNGNQVRAKVIGEGGNLGVTQRDASSSSSSADGSTPTRWTTPQEWTAPTTRSTSRS